MTTETLAWQSAHDTEPYHSQRTAKLPGKLKRLGVLGLDPDQRVLDTCCGGGEALAVLRQHGFRHLTGADSSAHPAWSGLPEVRFATCDVRQMPFADGEFDAIINLHALHHLADAVGVAAFLAECSRLLRPGGQLFILDFPGSLQINLLFWALRRRLGTITPSLRNFAEIVDEEWPYLSSYLRNWPVTEAVLETGPLAVATWRREFFLYYLTLIKPNTSGGA